MISVVIPVYNEEENVGPLHRELLGVLKNIGQPFEIIFINDGSTDNTAHELELLSSASIITLLRRVGKSKALQAGFDYASGDYIISLDGDLQDDPQEIPRFLEMITQRNLDAIIGWKYKRLDPFSKRFVSWIANSVAHGFSKIKIHDMNCGFKIFNARAAKSLHLHGDMHRYIPIVLSDMGFSVDEMKVNHRPRIHGVSKYGFGRLFSGMFDFMTLILLRKFLDRPMHFFGFFGLTSGLTGFVILSYISWEKLFQHVAIGTRPLLTLGVLLVLVGFQLFALGVIGEIMIRKSAPEKSETIIKSIVKQ